MNIDDFIKELEKLGIILSPFQLDQLEKYYVLLIEWNQKINLTGITEKKDVYLKHFFDSITLCKMINLSESLSLCDIGTGAGFPGMVLKIIFPSLSITLIDSLHKRILFLEKVKEELALENLEIIEARAEEYATKNREKFDIVTSRAVAQLSILLEYSIPLVKVNGYFIPMKSKVEDEKKNLERLQKILFFTLEKEETFYLPKEESLRNLLKFKKIKATPLIFPRKYSEIKKKPL